MYSLFKKNSKLNFKNTFNNYYPVLQQMKMCEVLKWTPCIVLTQTNYYFSVPTKKSFFLFRDKNIVCYAFLLFLSCPRRDGFVNDKLQNCYVKNIKIVFSSCIAIAIFMVRNQNYCKSYLGSSTVTTPLGWISTLFPQNLSLGWIEPWKTKCSLSAWKAEIGGWWLTCSHTTLWK